MTKEKLTFFGAQMLLYVRVPEKMSEIWRAKQCPSIKGMPLFRFYLNARLLILIFIAILLVTCSRQLSPEIDVSLRKNESCTLKEKHFKYIPSGTLFLPQKAGNSGSNEPGTDSRRISIAGFYMLDHEVTVGEYQLFLESLQQENKLEELKIAGIFPDTAQVLPVNYFTSPDFKDFPVVLISTEGAILFCDWLTKRVEKEPNGAGCNFDFRLPTTNEWIYAAMGGRDDMSYSSYAPYNNLGEKLLNFRDTGDVSIQKSLTYYCNDYGLYNMCGNVAEFAGYNYLPLNESQGKYIATYCALGGSWDSPVESVQIITSDLYSKVNSPSPHIGFRPAFSYLGRSWPKTIK